MPNWKYYKAQHEIHLDNADVHGEARKHILKFLRKTNTMRNFLDRGRSYDALWETDASIEAHELMDDLNDQGIDPTGGYGDGPVKYWTEWQAYCKEAGMFPRANMGDWMS